MLKKFELSIKENCLLHNCRCKIRENNYWDNIYQMRKDKLHLYCKACPIKLPIFYTLGFQIKKFAWDFIIGNKTMIISAPALKDKIIQYEIEIGGLRKC